MLVTGSVGRVVGLGQGWKKGLVGSICSNTKCSASIDAVHRHGENWGSLQVGEPRGEVLLYRTEVALESYTRQTTLIGFMFICSWFSNLHRNKVGQVEPQT